jgi:uncharacterized protein
MFSKTWRPSERKYSLRHDANVSVPVSAGHVLDGDVFRPDAAGRFPAIVCVHAYSKADQIAPLMPVGFSHARGHMESGDPNFYARRGYAQVLLNIRGTGQSGGAFGNLGASSIDDICEALEWVAEQSWCDGNIAMFGASYFSLVAGLVAARNPRPLKCIFAPFAWSDAYRDRYYQGGILNWGFSKIWFETLPETVFEPGLWQTWGRARFDRAVAAALDDPEIRAVPFLVNALKNPEHGGHRVILETLLRPFDGDYYRERSPDYARKPNVPAYFGACWGVYGTHLPGAFRNFAHFAAGTRRWRRLVTKGHKTGRGSVCSPRQEPPKPVIARLQSEVERVVREPDFLQKYMEGLGLEPILNSPQEFATFLREDRARAELLVRRSGLQLQ